MDLEDQQWLDEQSKKLNLTPEKFEKAIEFLEANCVYVVPTLDDLEDQSIFGYREAELIYDYWIDKRLKYKKSITFQLKKENKSRGIGSRKLNHEDPYISFRHCPEKVRTRKNRLKDYENYMKMLNLRNQLAAELEHFKTSKIAREQEKHNKIKLKLKNFEARYKSRNFNNKQLADHSVDSSNENHQNINDTVNSVDFIGWYDFDPLPGYKFFKVIVFKSFPPIQSIQLFF